MRTRRTRGFATANALEPVRDPGLGVLGGVEAVAEGYEQATDEDRDPAQVVAIQPAELGVQAAIEGHLGYELT